MNDQLIPMDIGPLNPTGWGLIIAWVAFSIVYLVLAKRLLPRINRVLVQRDQKVHGVAVEAEQVLDQAADVRNEHDAVLAAARHDAAHTRQQAYEEGTRLIAQAREEGMRERERILVSGRAAIEAERVAAGGELQPDLETWARELAERILGEPTGASVQRSRATD
ncbi:hypothetical protein AB0M39_32030 [Streptomyces sp. NPDC051907]|uniref:F0F1 ATP synthase subunit B family protein n=1 Tax=Streptomyces sp. NPDC051907 TaxID=3155284 RepID=UPI00343010E6